VKSESLKRIVPLACLTVPALLQPATAIAYVGPGAGLSIVGSLLAFFAAIIVGIFGFLWFPIRRVLRKRKQARKQMSNESQSVQNTPGGEPSAERVIQGDGDA
jgi:hypothetical protein